MTKEYETKREVPHVMKIPWLQIIIVTYNSQEVLPTCLQSIADSKLSNSFVVDIFDNDSVEPLEIEFQNYPFPIRYTKNPQNVGFGRANNQALLLDNSPYVLLLNPDASVDSMAIQSALTLIESDLKVGLVGGSLFSLEGNAQPSARFSPTVWSLFSQKIGVKNYFDQGRLSDTKWARTHRVECDWVPGCFYLFRRDEIQRIGLFDPRYFLYYEEVDHCKRMRDAGFKVVCDPTVKVFHIGGASAATVSSVTALGKQISPLQLESEALFIRKHFGLGGLLAHVALTYLSCIFVLVKVLLKAVLGKQPIVVGLHKVKQVVSEFTTLYRLTIKTNFGKRPLH